MTAPATLRDFVVAIQQAETVPRPDNEDWKAMIDRISVAGRIAEVDEDTYYHFLEVLPPHYQRGSFFAFAEGAEALRLFWQKGDRYFCRQFTWDETITFCRLTRISVPS